MSASADRSYLSIGDALNLLRGEFPDITISKIRFLESQGLIDPERTPSGYRKFYDDDVARLRFILREQRENFLPLKVIRDKLDDPSTLSEQSASSRRSPREPNSSSTGKKSPRKSARPGLTLTRDELASSSGLAVDRVQELERFGLVVGRQMGGETYYDENALVIANLAASFARFGVEARHLRIYKNAADREAGFFEQIVVALLKQRNSQARTEALATLSELSQLGQSMRSVLVRQAVDKFTSP